MVVRRLLGAMVDGVGLSAGAALFRELDRDEPEPPPETDAERQARLAREAKAAARNAKEAAARAKREKKELECELAALKKKVAAERR